MTVRRSVRVVAAVLIVGPAAHGQSPKLPPVTRPADAAPPPLPSTRPASRPTSGPTTVAAPDPAAVRWLNRAAAAYGPARPLTVAGTLVGTFDVAGRRRVYTLQVRGVTDGQGRFAHRAEGVGLLVNDGHDAYVFDAGRNTYARLPASTQRAGANGTAAVDASVVSVLLDENPALLLTLTTDPAALLTAASQSPLRPATGPTTTATRPTTGPTTGPASATGPAEVGLVVDRGGKTVTLWADPVTGEIRRAVLDYGPAFAARHTYGLKTARVELTYDPPTHGPPPATAFAWQPPVTATEFTLPSELLQAEPTTRATGPTTSTAP